ncbi:hypothetical protein AWB64_04396 [Caballeronia sordidicola]|uniref:Uncharacterized protein n=1 Tax=Caballeronia sordidicola TaxID=196367 RepID=A0A158HAY3_CABSO|nr:hypothetical protein AWB64_04396 [Caballeronia sordidicola]
MITHPKRLALAGVFIAALAGTVYLPRLMQTALHHDQSASDGDDSSAADIRDMPRTSGNMSKDAPPDPSPARILQAVRDSLHRNDLASADVLLRAARALDINNPQAIALQHDLDARMPLTHTAPPAALAKGEPTIQQAESRPVPRTSRVINRAGPARERANRVPLRARKSGDIRAGAVVARNSPVEPVVRIREQNEKSASSDAVTFRDDAVNKVMPEVAPASAPVIAASPVMQRTIQPEPQPMQPIQPPQGPKSREQVRAELERARTDGSLPRFGNPDPAGPGVTTISKALLETPNH